MPGADGAGAPDTIQVRGDTILKAGQPYTFKLELAKKTALPAPRADAAPVLVRDAVPAFGDSARACLQGDGFVIVLDEAPAGERCSVKRLADRAQRTWIWTVRPDTVSRTLGPKRVLLFSAESYGNNLRDDFRRDYPVTILVAPPTWFERVIRVVTSTEYLLAKLVAIAAAIAALLKYLRRKPPETDGSPST